MNVLRSFLLAGRPDETRFFAFLGAFGLVLGAIYWFASYEVAGTALLLGFGLAGVLAAVRLLVARPMRVAGGVDRPFLDETGRLPDETLAPLALGLGIALSMTAIVFGPWLLVAGIVPLGWGAWTWLRGARDELDATIRTDPGEQPGD